MDANHGSVFKTVGFTGVVLLALGIVFYYSSVPETSNVSLQHNQIWALCCHLCWKNCKMAQGLDVWHWSALYCTNSYGWGQWSSNQNHRSCGKASWLVMCITLQSKPMSCNQFLAWDIWLYVVWAPPITRRTKPQKCGSWLCFSFPYFCSDGGMVYHPTPFLSELIRHNGSMLHAEVLVVPRNEEDSGNDGFCHSARCVCPSVSCKIPNMLHFPTCNFSICGSFSLCNNLINC